MKNCVWIYVHRAGWLNDLIQHNLVSSFKPTGLCKGWYTYDVHENCPIFKTPLLHPPCPATSKILPTPWPWTSNFKRNPLPLQMITKQLKRNVILGWLLYVIRSFLQFGFPFQYQLINFVRLSIDFVLFSWSQSHRQSNLKKLKTYFSPSS